jgi:hypothetical protein
MTYLAYGFSTERLIMTFPLNGDESIGCRIYLHENNSNDTQFFVIIDDRSDSRLERPTLAEAIATCLNNSGWGTFHIKDVTNE